MATRGLRVAVVGAGIGGLAAAAGLRRGGADVVVFEAGPELRAAGSALTIWSNGVAALRSLGLDGKLLAHAQPFGRTVSLARGDRVVGDWRVATDVPSVTVLRADLLSLLAAAAGTTEIRFGAPVASVRDDGPAARVELSSGERSSFDLVICADGAGSRLRQCFGGGAQIGPATEWSGWQGVASGPVEGLPADALTAVYGARAGGLSPLRDGLLHWFVDRAGDGAPPADASRDELVSWVGGHSPLLAAAIAATDPGQIRHDEIREHLHRGGWVGPRTALLGDAAHAMVPALGQGACQALEDAAVLVHCLSVAGVPDALASYQRARRRRARQMVRGARVMLRFRQHARSGTLIRLTPRPLAEAALPLALRPPAVLASSPSGGSAETVGGVD